MTATEPSKGYLFAKVENFTRFQGENLSAEPVGRFARKGGTPNEMYNFSVASDGLIYGYLPKNWGGELQRLGGKKDADEVSNVTVIFASRGILCGYYTNATVLSSSVWHPDGHKTDNGEIYYRVKVNPKDAFLIPIEKRKDEIQPWPQGQAPVRYGDTRPRPGWVEWFEKFTQRTKARHSIATEQKRRKWAEQVERSSEARELALGHYGHTCECCKISDEDNIRAAVFEVHHKVPFAKNFKKRKLKSSNLAVLCANCHRMIHKMPDVADIEGLRGYLNLD